MGQYLAMMGILLSMILVATTGAVNDTDEASKLIRGAQELLKEGQPAKALVQLQRARALDSIQEGIDQLMWRCRIKMGEWVPPDAARMNAWIELEKNGLDAILPSKFDSLYQVGQDLEAKEDLGTAIRIYSFLVRKVPDRSDYVETFKVALSKQDLSVAAHLGIAEDLVRKGRLSEALVECRLALFAKPDDPALQRRVDDLESAVRVSVDNFRSRIARDIASRDPQDALDVVQQALVVHPDDSTFRRQADSLIGAKRTVVASKLEEVGRLIDAGQETRAVGVLASAMKDYPDDPIFAQTFEELKERINKKRQKAELDALSRSFEAAIARGDAGRAKSLVANMQGKGVKASTLERMGARVDSLREAQAARIVVDEGLASARKALGANDKASAKVALQQSLSKNPDNTVAKGLLEDLNKAESAPAPARPEPAARAAPPSKELVWMQQVNTSLLSGIASYRKGDYKAALDSWNEVVKMDPSNQEARRYIANVRQKLARLGQ